MKTTVKEYAEKNGLSVSAARRRLEALRLEGKATVQVVWTDVAMPLWARPVPSVKTNVYTIAE
jgi:predicted ArsR family transcriptional regulator